MGVRHNVQCGADVRPESNISVPVSAMRGEGAGDAGKVASAGTAVIDGQGRPLVPGDRLKLRVGATFTSAGRFWLAR